MSKLRPMRILMIFTLLALAAALAHANTITTVDGEISVTAVVTLSGSLYTYDYTVADATGLLAVLDIAVTPGISITNIQAPGGASAFETAYDSGLGLVSFLENNAVFTDAPEAGFTFESPVAPGASSFDVTLFDGTTGSGSVEGPLVSSVPEPGSWMLCALAGAVLLSSRKRLPLSRFHIIR